VTLIAIPQVSQVYLTTELVAEHVLTSTLFLDPKKRRNNVKAMTCTSTCYTSHF